MPTPDRVLIDSFGSLRRACSAALWVGLTFSVTASAQGWPYGLRPSFSKSGSICKEAFENARMLSGCRAFDAVCPEGDTNVPSGGEHVATNTYGYTEIYQLRRRHSVGDLALVGDLAPEADDEPHDSIPDGMAILFLNRFQGDRHARLIEMWKVDSGKLDEVLALPLPEVDPDKWPARRERNADEFEAMLKQGTRLAAQWAPLLAMKGKLYFVERECSGAWASGGYYACNQVIKLTFKRIETNQEPVPYCQLARPRNVKKAKP
jgi:hypothetical protein